MPEAHPRIMKMVCNLAIYAMRHALCAMLFLTKDDRDPETFSGEYDRKLILFYLTAMLQYFKNNWLT